MIRVHLTPMLSVFRFVLALALVTVSVHALESRPYCEVKVGENVVKVFLEADEAVGEGFKPGIIQYGSGRTRKSPEPKFTPFTRVLVHHSKVTA
jgi:hypothetical protein